MKELKKLRANVHKLFANSIYHVKSLFFKIVKAFKSILEILINLICESSKQAFTHFGDYLIFLPSFVLSYFYRGELRNYILYFINDHQLLIINNNQIKILALIFAIFFLILFLIHKTTIKSFKFSLVFSFIQLTMISLPLMALTFLFLRPFNIKLAFMPYFFIPVFIVFFILFSQRRISYYFKENEFIDSKLENVLRKKIKEPRWFRLDPYWIDFEKGTIVERDELNEILKALRKHRFYYIHGAPASGKSVLLKNIGFKLAKKGHWVSYFDVREEIKEPKIFERFIDLPNHIIILDNIHSKPTTCNKIYSIIKDKKFCRLILGSRPSYADAFELLKERREEEDEITRDLESNIIFKTEIKAQKIAEALIKFYCKYENKEIDEIGINKFDRHCGDDLVYLGYFLNNWEGGEVDLEQLEKKVSENIHKDLQRLNRKCNDAIDIIFTLAAFTCPFEFAISMDFLTEKLNVERSCIEVLKREGEIREIEAKSDGKKVFRYSLWHSSVARLFLKAAYIYEDLIKGVINRAGVKKFPEDLIYSYIKSCSFDFANLIVKMAVIFKDFKERQEFFKKVFLNIVKHPPTKVKKVRAIAVFGLAHNFSHLSPDDQCKAINIFLLYSNDDNLETKAGAIYGLVNSHDYLSTDNRRKATKLFLLLAEDENPLVIRLALPGLALNFVDLSSYDKSKTLSIFLKMAEYENPQIREGAIWAIVSNFGYISADDRSKAMKIFFGHSEDENPKAREYAILGIFKNFDDLIPKDKNKALKIFLKSSEDKNPQTRIRCILILSKDYKYLSHDDRRRAFEIFIRNSQDENKEIKRFAIGGIIINFDKFPDDLRKKTLIWIFREAEKAGGIIEYIKQLISFYPEISEQTKKSISKVIKNITELYASK